MLKLDVQGFEQGGDWIRIDAAAFRWVYCECSFIELYLGQKPAGRDRLADLQGLRPQEDL